MFGATTSTAMTVLLTHMSSFFAVRSENTQNLLLLYGESDTALKRIINFTEKKKEIKKPANGYLSPKGVFSLRQCLTSEFGMGSGGTTVINRRNRENYSLKTKYHVQYI